MLMALLSKGERYCLLTSTDALNWRKSRTWSLKEITNVRTFFPILDEWRGTLGFLEAPAAHVIGIFDGHHFEPQTAVKHLERGTNGYAAQTWSDTSHRRIQISWMASGVYPENAFNQQLSIPVELKLRGSGEKMRLTRWPVGEIESLRKRTIQIESRRSPRRTR